MKWSNQYMSFRKYALNLSLAMGVLFLIFALVSGAESGSNSFKSILTNSPNALPWLLYVLLVILAKRNGKIITVALLIYTIAILYFFNFSGSNFFLITFIFTLGICLLAIVATIGVFRNRA